MRPPMRRALVLACLLLAAPALAGCVDEAPAATDAPSLDPRAPRTLYVADCAVAPAPSDAWPEGCLAHASPNPSPSKTEVDAAVNPRDPLHVVVASKDLDTTASDCVWSVAQVSRDGGRTWTTSYVGGTKETRPPASPLAPWACITDPILVFDQEGTLYYALQAYDVAQKSPLPTGAGSAILLARSRDGGDTWDKVTTLHAGDGVGAFHDYMRAATSPATGSVFVAWNQISGLAASEPVLVASRDGGESAAPPVYLPVPASPAGARQTGVAVAPDGTVHVMLMAGRAAYLVSSDDDGRTFGLPVEAFTVTPVDAIPNVDFRVFTFVELAAAPDGCLHAAWTDGRAGEGDADVYHAASCDGGASWTRARKANPDASGTDQFMPRLVVDARGTVHVAYMTRAYDAANTLVDVEWAYSTDQGASWTAKRLTTASFDGDLGVHQSGFPFLGDYLGIATSGDRTYVGAPTTATGVAEIAVAALTPRDA